MHETVFLPADEPDVPVSACRSCHRGRCGGLYRRRQAGQAAVGGQRLQRHRVGGDRGQGRHAGDEHAQAHRDGPELYLCAPHRYGDGGAPRRRGASGRRERRQRGTRAAQGRRAGRAGRRHQPRLVQLRGSARAEWGDRRERGCAGEAGREPAGPDGHAGARLPCGAGRRAHTGCGRAGGCAGELSDPDGPVDRGLPAKRGAGQAARRHHHHVGLL